MGIVAAFDKVLFFNPASKYSILRLKTANEMVPEDARDTYKFSDHLIRFVAVGYAFEDLDKLDLAYANTIHKAQGSEYDVVIIPVLPAHKILLTLNLFYTAITRAKRRVILVGQKRAIYIAVHKSGKGKRNTLLAERIRLYYRALTASAETDGGSMKKAS